MHVRTLPGRGSCGTIERGVGLDELTNVLTGVGGL